jgi:plastocyanin
MSIFIRNGARNAWQAQGVLRRAAPGGALGLRSRNLVLGAVLGLHALAASDAQAAELSGRITLVGGGEPQAASLNPYPGSMGATEAAPARRSDDPRDLVLYLETGLESGPEPEATGRAADVPGRTRGAEAPAPRLMQAGRSFSPRVLGVTAGTRVDFPNADAVFHNVFSYSKAKRFDLGYYGKGKSKSVVFDTPGLIKVFCDIHASMSAYILVVATPFVVQPDALGDYRIVGLPPGDYRLRLWHPERGELSRAVTVAEAGTRLDLSF